MKEIELEQVLPQEIEKRSFEIITEELGDVKLVPGTEPVVKRCIHTSADFDYAKNLVFSEGVIEHALKVLGSGATIVTDTQMAMAGVNKRKLAALGCQIRCFMSDPDVAEEAKKSEIVKQQLKNPDINVFTNKKFGTDKGDHDFNMDSLFTVDEAALQKAFKCDENAMSNLGNSLDFSGADLEKAFRVGGDSFELSNMVNLEEVQLDLSGMPQLNLGEILSKLDLSVSPDGLKQMASSLSEGYLEYAKTHPEADYSHLLEDFTEYLKTDEAKKIIEDNIKDIIKGSASVTITPEQIQKLLKDIMAGFLQYVTDNGYTDVSKFGEYLQEYLQTDEAKRMLASVGDGIQIDDIEVNITAEQMTKLANELYKGYQNYASVNGKPDPSKMGEQVMNETSGRRTG